MQYLSPKSKPKYSDFRLFILNASYSNFTIQSFFQNQMSEVFIQVYLPPPNEYASEGTIIDCPPNAYLLLFDPN